MKGKTVVITGATSGIGRATALALAKQGARVIFNTRDLIRGEAVCEALQNESGNPEVEVYPGDLASFTSIREFAQDVLAATDRIDVLINNAGVWMTEFKTSEEGYEYTLAVNHLAPFLLTHLLLDRLKASAPARIVNLSSALHTRGQVVVDELGEASGEGKFDGMQLYSDTKLMNALFSLELSRQLEGTGVTSNAVHPGLISTNLARDTNALMKGIFRMIGKKTRSGAEPIVHLASSPELEGVSGVYFDRLKPRKPASAARDTDLAQALWAKSLELSLLSEREREE
ncbi:MAG: SDR family oxidoreductase [Bacteroidetes bacterium]|nr:MAG: SDR family oxidoreductase [Bacteroidota bacterium]